MSKTPFEGFDFSDFWNNDSEYARKNYIGNPPTDAIIKEVEEELGYKLPEAYIFLMKQQNGGYPSKTDFPIAKPTSWAGTHVSITGIMGVDRSKNNSLCGSTGSRFMIDEWEYPDIGVAICDCPSAGHDMIFLDYRECGPKGEPKVVHIDNEADNKITFLADNFEDFIRGLTNYVDETENEKSESEKIEPLSLTDEELRVMNENRKKAGFPPIDKFRNPIV